FEDAVLRQAILSTALRLLSGLGELIEGDEHAEKEKSININIKTKRYFIESKDTISSLMASIKSRDFLLLSAYLIYTMGYKLSPYGQVNICHKDTKTLTLQRQAGNS
ncbi:MAG: hypothetical protein V1709_04125, partial [Planctomycetota bacterium]